MAKRATTEDVKALVDAGAQIVDVLPASSYAEEHLPGAVSIPMPEIDQASERLDPSRPVVVYCYDHQCDLSARAAARLDAMGFAEVYDYVDSKVAWFAEGLPSQGATDDSHRAVARLRVGVPTLGPDAHLGEVGKVVGDWELVVVTDDDNVVLGVVRAEAEDVAPDVPVARVMQPAPRTVRPSIPLRELAESMDKDGEHTILVTTLHGELLGIVRRADLDLA